VDEVEAQEVDSALQDDVNQTEGIEVDDKTQIDTTSQACENENDVEVTDLFDADFYIPDCAVLDAVLEHVSKTERKLKTYFRVEKKNWEEIADEYTDLFAENVYEDSKDLQKEQADIKFYLYENEEGNTWVKIIQFDDYAQFYVENTFPDS